MKFDSGLIKNRLISSGFAVTIPLEIDGLPEREICAIKTANAVPGKVRPDRFGAVSLLVKFSESAEKGHQLST